MSWAPRVLQVFQVIKVFQALQVLEVHPNQDLQDPKAASDSQEHQVSLDLQVNQV